MKRYILGYYRYHKFLTLIIIILSFKFTAVVLSINTIMDHVVLSNIEKLKDKYGEQHLVIHDTDEAIESLIADSNMAKKTGHYYNYGQYSIAGTDYYITLGCFDDNGYDLGRIKLVEGRFPENEYEICLEEHFKYYLFDTEINMGDLLKIDIGDSGRSYSVCGFISDYSGCWINVEDLVAGYNDYPGGIIFPFGEAYPQKTNNMLVLLHGTDKYSVPAGTYTSFLEKTDIYDNQIFNDDVYYTYYSTMISPVLMYKNVFLILYAVAGSFMFYYIFYVFLSGWRNREPVFEAIGLSGNRKLYQTCLLTFVPYVIGTILGSAVLIVFFSLFRNGTYFGPLLGTFTYLLVVPLVYILTQLSIVFSTRLSRRKNKAEKDFKDGYIYGLARVNFRKKYRRVLSLLLVIAISLTGYFCIDMDKRYRDSQYIEAVEDIVIAYANPYKRIIQAGPFELSSYEDGYRLNQVKELMKEIKPIATSFAYYFDSSNYLIIPSKSGDRYWEMIEEEWYENTGLIPSTVEPKSIPGLGTDTVGTQLYATFTVKDSNIGEFRKQFPEIDVEKDLAKGRVVLYLAPKRKGEAYNQQNEVTDDSKITENYYEPGDNIRLGKLYTDSSLDEAQQDPGKITFVSDELVISKIYREDFYYTDSLQTINVNLFPRIIWTEETADACVSVNGIEQFQVSIPRNISDDEYNELIRKIYRVGYSTKNSKIHETKFMNDFLDRLYTMLNISYTVILLLMTISLGISICSIIYISIIEQKRSYGILRILGMKKQKVLRVNMTEYLLYWLIGFTLTPVVCYLAVSIFAGRILHTVFALNEILRYLMTIIVFYILLSLGIIVIGYMVTSRLYRMSIGDSISYGE